VKVSFLLLLFSEWSKAPLVCVITF